MTSVNSGYVAEMSGSIEDAVVHASDKDYGSAGSITNISETHQPLQGANPTGAVGANNKSDESTGMSTQLLVGVIAGSVVILLTILLLIRSRRRRHKHKMLSPSNFSAFQGVSSTTANVLESSMASTAITSPQLPRMQTIKLPQRKKSTSQEHVIAGIDEAPTDALSSARATQIHRATSLVSSRSVFSASILMRGGLRPSLPNLAAFRPSRHSESTGDNRLQSMDSSASTISYARTGSAISYSNDAGTPALPPPERHTIGDAWRDLSETCWSIGPGDSDSESESDRHYSAPVARTQGVPRRNRLSTLSDIIADIEEEDGLDTNSLDDSSRRRERAMDMPSTRERGISALDDSSPRRIRGLSALEIRYKANSAADTQTNGSAGSYFSVDSEFYDETIKDCSNLPFAGSESDSDSGDSVREEWF